MQYKRRRRIERGSSSSNTGQMMNLSLFIMLLAFFIVLNSISSYEEKKTEEVRQSLDVTFSTDVRREDFNPSITKDPVKSVNKGDVFERLEALFEAQIIAFEASKSRAKGVMMVKMSYDDFSKAMKALDQQDLTKNPTRMEAHKNVFLPTLVSLMKTNIDGAPTRLEIYFHVDENPAQIQNQKPQKLNVVINDVGKYSTLLQNNGLPQKLLNIGVSKGDPKFVQLVFRKYRPFSPVKPSEKEEP